jgi:replicative DNA helicase
LEDHRIDLLPEDEDADPTTWAIEQLHSVHALAEFQQFTKDSSMDVAQASPPEKVKVLTEQSNRLFALAQSFQPHHMRAEFGAEFFQALADYEIRAAAGHTHRGLRLGLPPVDDHTFGIHPGEMAILAGGPKTGKSYALGHIAKEAWKREEVTCLFTLENSVEMTIQRLVCMTLGIDSERWQRGECHPLEVERVRQFVNDELPALMTEGRLHILSPETGQRTIPAMVRQAQMFGAKAILIDQTSHVEHVDPGRKPQHQIVSENLHLLKLMVSTAAEPMAAVIAHQINREGVRQARKTGYLEMDMLAESSGAERSADWVFGIYQSSDDRIAGEAILQILAARRAALNAWKMVWQPSRGHVAIIGEHTVEESAA